jgi:hypothetical protein
VGAAGLDVGVLDGDRFHAGGGGEDGAGGENFMVLAIPGHHGEGFRTAQMTFFVALFWLFEFLIK